MASLSADQILAAPDRPTLGPIAVPEWGGDVYIRTLSLAERLKVAEAAGAGSLVPFSLLGVLAIGDADGARVFSDDQAAALADKSPTVLERLGRLILEHNRMRPEDTEDAAKN